MVDKKINWSRFGNSLILPSLARPLAPCPPSLILSTVTDKPAAESRVEIKLHLLHDAASTGDLEMVRELMGKRFPVNPNTPHLYTPLYLAARSGHWEIVRELAQEGADLETPGDEGATALCIAAVHGHW